MVEVFFYHYRGSQDLPLNELKPKSLESIIEAWTSTEKTEKTHHEHGGLLCFLAVNSACVMTKELSSFWTKGSRFVLEPQTISWLSGPICSLLLTEPGPIVFCDYNSPVCVQLWRRIKKKRMCYCSTSWCLEVGYFFSRQSCLVSLWGVWLFFILQRLSES